MFVIGLCLLEFKFSFRTTCVVISDNGPMVPSGQLVFVKYHDHAEAGTSALIHSGGLPEGSAVALSQDPIAG